MDVHDGLGPDQPEDTQAMWEPPGYESGDSGTAEPSGYDGGDSGGGHSDGGDSGGGYSGGGDPGSGAAPGDGGTGSGTMTVEVEGQTRELPAERDYTGDGKADAVVETADGKVIVFADTEDNASGGAGPDGKADEAYIVDKQTGQVVGAAHVDPSSGTWVEGADQDGPGAVASEGTGGAGSTGGADEPATTSGGGGSAQPDQQAGVVTVEYGGHEVGVAKTIDTDGDGVADSGVLYTDGRAVVLTDTDGDPAAEQAAAVDSSGQVVQVAHVDPETGEWEEGPAPGYGSGSEATGSGSEGSGAGHGEGGTGTTGAAGTMTVKVDGRTQDLPAERDYTGDGQGDAAVETKDGQVIVFADTEDNETGAAGPDGRADEAWIVDKSTGKVVGAAHVDPRTGEWVDGADSDGPSSVPSGASS